MRRSSHEIPHTVRQALIRKILKWYAVHGRALPWRNITNPYRILVSEVMLQQTQVYRVRTKYPEFLQAFPTLTALSEAQQRDVVVAWRGLGYNNRAVRLHRLAKQVMQRHGGKFPQSFQDLLHLPGIGRYTANALLSSAFRQDVPVVDVNIQRFLSRVFWRMSTTAGMRTAKEIWTLAEVLVPKGKAYQWSQALMDLGATVCTARAPLCKSCPAASLCASRRSMRLTNRTDKKRKTVTNGIPNRIFRGQIIETLRQVRGRRRLSHEAIGKKIRRDYSPKDKAWIESLLLGLEKDGLIRRTGAGRWDARRISLA